MSVMFYNPSTSSGGNSNTLPTFQLFQNWDGGYTIPALQQLKLWFGGVIYSDNIPFTTQQFLIYTQGNFGIQIKKIFLYHSPIFNAENVDFSLVDVGTSSTLIGQLNGNLPTQMSEIICDENLIEPLQQIQLNILNNQVANVFTVYQLTILCERVVL